jgi:hypothetical protein
VSDTPFDRLRAAAATDAAKPLQRWRVVEVWRREYEVEAINRDYARLVADDVALDSLDLTFEGYESIEPVPPEEIRP